MVRAGGRQELVRPPARGADLGALEKDPRWREPRSRPGEAAWTDDFSNIIEHLVIGLR